MLNKPVTVDIKSLPDILGGFTRFILTVKSGGIEYPDLTLRCYGFRSCTETLELDFVECMDLQTQKDLATLNGEIWVEVAITPNENMSFHVVRQKFYIHDTQISGSGTSPLIYTLFLRTTPRNEKHDSSKSCVTMD